MFRILVDQCTMGIVFVNTEADLYMQKNDVGMSMFQIVYIVQYHYTGGTTPSHRHSFKFTLCTTNMRCSGTDLCLGYEYASYRRIGLQLATLVQDQILCSELSMRSTLLDHMQFGTLLVCYNKPSALCIQDPHNIL